MTDFREQKKTSMGFDRVQTELREGSKLEVFSQNFCDKRTWFSDSARKTGVSATDSGDGYIFTLPDQFIIDISHGRISNEAVIHPSHITNIYINGVLAVEHTPDTLKYAGGVEYNDWSEGTDDYGLDYKTGTIYFKENQGGKTITADYSTAQTSKWYLKPDPGKIIRLMAAELQFSTDARMKSDFVFQARADVGKHPLLKVVLDSASNPAKTSLVADYVWNGTTTVICSDTSEISVGEFVTPDGYGAYYYVGAVIPDTAIVIVDVLGIGFIPAGTLPSAKSPMALFPSGTILPLGEPTRYKNKLDIINESNVSHPLIIKDDGYILGWRDQIYDIAIFRWDYAEQAAIEIPEAWGMDIEMSLSDDIPASGWAALVTFYGLSEDYES